jgi:hypothetical protein
VIVLLGLGLGSRERYESWLAFGRDLVARGMSASPKQPLPPSNALPRLGPSRAAHALGGLADLPTCSADRGVVACGAGILAGMSEENLELFRQGLAA